MPKIIPNVREKILETALSMLRTSGYSQFNMRKLASECNIAVGTVYNYFDGVDAIAAELILSEWKRTLEAMDASVEVCEGFPEGIEALGKVFAEFIEKYRPIWKQYSAMGNAKYYTGKYHEKLIQQIEEKIERLLIRSGRKDIIHIKAVLAEAFLACILNREDGPAEIKLLASALTPLK